MENLLELVLSNGVESNKYEHLERRIFRAVECFKREYSADADDLLHRILSVLFSASFARASADDTAVLQRPYMYDEPFDGRSLCFERAMKYALRMNRLSKMQLDKINYKLCLHDLEHLKQIGKVRSYKVQVGSHTSENRVMRDVACEADIPRLVSELIYLEEHLSTKRTIFDALARLDFATVEIHPYGDGNGRMSMVLGERLFARWVGTTGPVGISRLMCIKRSRRDGLIPRKSGDWDSWLCLWIRSVSYGLIFSIRVLRLRKKMLKVIEDVNTVDWLLTHPQTNARHARIKLGTIGLEKCVKENLVVMHNEACYCGSAVFAGRLTRMI